MEAVDEEYDDFDEDEEFEASEEEEGEEEAGGEVSVVRVPQLEKRSEQLRQACTRQLGAEVFAAVYQYLRSKSADFYAADYDIQMRNDLLRICGEGRLRFWPLVDQLIFCEDVEKDAHRHVGLLLCDEEGALRSVVVGEPLVVRLDPCAGEEGNVGEAEELEHLLHVKGGLFDLDAQLPR